ncbi:serine/threonine-protein kinase [Aquisphaera insulae]|uniref:serine/threonine-protein kinase n=1 Tax=Aquisphaera insulae TaxID=2712864 RepID=UPI0013EB2533|nr:serine/threonine-protein kinase [Aquisphaera insulae]
MVEDQLEGLPIRRTVGDFLATLELSGVLSDSEIRAIRKGVGRNDDPQAVASRLVEGGNLTEFQAGRLLLGKSSGLVFNRYVLLDRIGLGAMGRVFKARHRLMDRVVALKVVLPAHATSSNAVNRFFREMKIVGLLDHPNVVRAFDADQFEGSPFIVMEYLEGEDLEKALRRRGILPPDEVVGYMAQAAWGLAHAHEKGVIHRDIKPTNLFLTNTGFVRVLDLGLGAFVGVSSAKTEPHDTDEGFVVGTTDYMSPEQLSGESMDARTDLFSLGCAMYRLLTGKYAFPGATKMDRMLRRVSQPHVPITEIRPDLSLPLVRAIDRLLALRAEDRFESAGEVAEALESLLPKADRPSSRRALSSTIERRVKAPVAIHATPDDPLDWSRIESALRPDRKPASDPSPTPPPSSSPRIEERPAFRPDAPRHELDDDEEEADLRRELAGAAHKDYRKEVIELKKAIASGSEQVARSATVHSESTWLERVGEQIGDFLAEPSASHIIYIVIAITLIVAVGLALVAV